LYDRSYEEESGNAQRLFAAHPRLHCIGRHAQFAHKDVDEILEEAKSLADTVMGHASPALDVLAPGA
jgi:hypothetical protein